MQGQRLPHGGLLALLHEEADEDVQGIWKVVVAAGP